MNGDVVCEACGAVLSAGSEVCEECGAELAAPVPAATQNEDLPTEAPPPPEPKPSAGWLRQIPGFRTGSVLERALAMVGYPIIFALLLSAISGNWFAFILGLDLLAIILLAANTWGLRRRLPLFGSGSTVRSAGAWLGLALVGVVAFWAGVPQGLALPAATEPGPAVEGTATRPSAQPATPGKVTLSSAALAALQAEVTRARQTATPTQTRQAAVYKVGNTGGDGVSIRRTPEMSDRLTAWGDGTPMVVVGDDRQGDGRLWKNVRDPAGNVGWIPAEYLEESPATPAPVATAGQTVLAEVKALTEKINRETSIPFFQSVELRLNGAQLAVTVSDAWYELPTHWKERTVEMLADQYATLAAAKGMRGAAPGVANYPRTTFYDTFGKELAYKSASETVVYR